MSRRDRIIVMASVAALVVLLLVKVVFARHAAAESVLPIRGLATDLATVMALCAPALVFWHKRGARAALVVIALVVSFTLGATMVYQRYFYEIPSFVVLEFAGQTGDVGGSIADLFRLSDLLMLPDLPILGWLMLSRGAIEPRKLDDLPIVGVIAAGMVGAVLLWTGMQAVATAPGLPNSGALARTHGIFAYEAGSLFRQSGAAQEPVLLPAADVVARIAELKGAAPTGRATDVAFGAAAGSNLIIIQAEALQTMLIGAELDGVEITPNLNALVKESWYFPLTFSQLGGGNTSDVEFTSNTSLYAPAERAASVVWEDRVVPSLPRLLAGEGYTSMTFHTNDAGFWNRRNLYAALGFDTYYDRSFFGKSDRIAFGASDEVLYAKTLDVLLEQRDRGVPFYADIITMSAHHPFTEIPAEKNPVPFTTAYPDARLGDYATAQEYADRALGGFIAELKRTGLWDESVIIIFGDHAGLTGVGTDTDDTKALRDFLGHDYNLVDRLGVPLIIHLPGQTESVTSAAPAGQLDIMPTALDVLGIKASGTPMFGRSLFAGGPTFVGHRRAVPAGSYVSEDAFVRPGDEPGTGTALQLAAPFSVNPATPEQIAGLATMVELVQLSDGYANGLPVRPDFVKDENANVPTGQ